VTKIGRSVLPAGDISTFKRPNNCEIHAEHSARRIKLRNKLTTLRNTRSFFDFDKNDRNFLPFGDVSKFKRPKNFILRAEYKSRRIMRRHKPNYSQHAIILRF
jgi:hypothetical protein